MSNIRSEPVSGGRAGEDVTETLEVIPRQWKVIQRIARCTVAGVDIGAEQVRLGAALAYRR